MTAVYPPLSRSAVVWGMTRALVWMTGLIVLYMLGPLEDVQIMPSWLSLALSGALLIIVSVFQIRAIERAPHPGLRAVEALAVTVPLYVLLFASAYFVMELDDPANFDVAGLTKVDALYFTVTTFSSVGFGDISPASQAARILVTVQMILNLLVLGAGIRVFIGAVRRTRARMPHSSAPH